MSHLLTLQARTREYLQVLQLAKKKREDLKKVNGSLKGLSDEILHLMVDNNVPNCSSMGFTFSVKDKTRAKTLTAKGVIGMLQDFFNLPESSMTAFAQALDKKKADESEQVHVLECKPIKSSGGGNAPSVESGGIASIADAVEDDISLPDGLSDAVNELYG